MDLRLACEDERRQEAAELLKELDGSLFWAEVPLLAGQLDRYMNQFCTVFREMLERAGFSTLPELFSVFFVPIIYFVRIWSLYRSPRKRRQNNISGIWAGLCPISNDESQRSAFRVFILFW